MKEIIGSYCSSAADALREEEELSAKSFIPNVNREPKYNELEAVKNAKIPDCSPGGCELIEALLESNEYKDDGRSEQEIENSILRAEIERHLLLEEDKRLDKRKEEIHQTRTKACASIQNDENLLRRIRRQKLMEK